MLVPETVSLLSCLEKSPTARPVVPTAPICSRGVSTACMARAGAAQSASVIGKITRREVDFRMGPPLDQASLRARRGNHLLGRVPTEGL